MTLPFVRMPPARALPALLAVLLPLAPASAQDRAAVRPQPSRGEVTGDMLGTMQHGLYQCALPGDAAGDTVIEQPNESFRLDAGSSYKTPAGSGVYLMHGTTLVFTRGPKKDQQFRRLGPNMLQALTPDGKPGRLICTRRGSAD